MYKGTHAVIMMANVTKQYTLEYVERELGRVPPELPVLVVGNFCDAAAGARAFGRDEAIAAVSVVQRAGSEPADVFYADASMANGFGLMFVYRFLNIPFLRLQRVRLLKQLDSTTMEFSAAKEELAVFVRCSAACPRRRRCVH